MVESVVLLHGIARSKRSMASLARRLEAEGYRVLNLDYPSRRLNTQELAEWIHPAVAEFVEQSDGPVHFIGHSMGGLVINDYLPRYPCAKLGHVVMLGTPLHGSRFADMLRDNPLFRAFFGPAGQQLTTDIERRAAAMPSVGIIAGESRLNPLSGTILGETSDGTVAISSTRPDIPHHHIIVPAAHMFMPDRPQVQDRVVQFLGHGKF